MTANKPGALNQKPLYGCTSCFEDYSWPAEDLRVFGSECWCDLCWEERGWYFPDQPSWNDLEPYTPALQAECEKLRALLLQSAPIIHAHAGASHMLEGFKPKRNKWDALVEQIDAACRKQQEGRPAPDVAKLVEALECALEIMENVDGENDCSRGINAAEEALAAHRKW